MAYPAQLRVGGGERATIGSAQRAQLEADVRRAAGVAGISYELSDRLGSPVGTYDADRNVLTIDSGLGAIESSDGHRRHPRAPGVLIDDLFRHAELYARGHTREQVWTKRAQQFGESPEEYFNLMDFLGASITNESKLHGRFTINKEQKKYFVGAGRRVPKFDRSVPLPSAFESPLQNCWYLSPYDTQRVAALLAKSAEELYRLGELLQRNGQQHRIAVVTTLFRERHRLDPEGGDSLRIKIGQLQEVSALTKGHVDWRLMFVPNANDPEQSGDYVCELIKRHYADAPEIRRRLCVHRKVGQADAQRLGAAPHLAPTKGNGILWGFRTLLNDQEGDAADVLAYTDLDTATDLRFFGLLLAPMVDDDGSLKRCASVGSREWEPPIGGIAVPDVPTTTEGRIGLVTVRIRRRFLLPTLPIIDTQAGFKAFPRHLLAEILGHARDPTFACDTELLTLALNSGAELRETPIFWSDTESSLSSADPNGRLEMLEGWLDQHVRLERDKALPDHVVSVMENRIKMIKDVSDDKEKVRLIHELEEWLASEGGSADVR